MSDQKSTEARWTAIVLAALAIATVLKVLWAVTSLGSSDAFLFCVFGKSLQHAPLRALYEGEPLFNHTPLTGIFVRWLYAACHGKLEDFSTAFRIPSIIADAGLVLGLLHVRKVTGRPPWWALALFAASPVSLMVSGFHANLDPVMVMLLFFAAMAVMAGRPALCGLLFAAACNVKMMPILFAPLFFFFWWARGPRTVVRFVIFFGTAMLLGSAVPLIECPAAYAHNVFGYGSYWGGWGVTYWLRQTGIPDFSAVDFHGLSHAQTIIMSALKAIVIASTLALGWRRRNVPPGEFFATVGATWVVLFVFAPGAAVQYMVWFAPFVLLLSPRWWAALTAGSSFYMFLFYHSASKYQFPWYFAFPTDKEVPFWSPWSNLPWATFIGLLFAEGRKWWNALPQPHPDSTDQIVTGIAELPIVPAFDAGN